MKIKAFSMLIVVFMLFSTVPLTSFAEADEVFVEHDLIDIDFEFTDLDNEAAPDGDMMKLRIAIVWKNVTMPSLCHCFRSKK